MNIFHINSSSSLFSFTFPSFSFYSSPSLFVLLFLLSLSSSPLLLSLLFFILLFSSSYILLLPLFFSSAYLLPLLLPSSSPPFFPHQLFTSSPPPSPFPPPSFLSFPSSAPFLVFPLYFPSSLFSYLFFPCIFFCPNLIISSFLRLFTNSSPPLLTLLSFFAPSPSQRYPGRGLIRGGFNRFLTHPLLLSLS